MLNCIKDLMADRTIQVRIGNKLSNRFEIENGTPQGSVIKPIHFFSVMVNYVFNQVKDSSRCFLQTTDSVEKGKECFAY